MKPSSGSAEPPAHHSAVAGSEYSGGILSGMRLGYTQVELALIADSHTLDGDGSRKRTLVRDSEGRRYTMAGMNRWAGDFTVLAGFPLYKFQEPEFKPYWIRQPDADDPPESIRVWTSKSGLKEMVSMDDLVCQSQHQYVLEMRKGRLCHRTPGMGIRPEDTIGMFHGGMTLLFDNRSEEDIRKEAELLAKACPGCFDELEDDIIAGVSPR